MFFRFTSSPSSLCFFFFNSRFCNSNNFNYGKRLPSGYWRCHTNRQNFFKFICKKQNKINICWKTITAKEINKYGGSGLITQFGNLNNLKTYYLQLENNENNDNNDHSNNNDTSIYKQREILESKKHVYNIKSNYDWFYITKAQLYKDKHIGPILSQYLSNFHMITSIFSIPPPLDFTKSIPKFYWGDSRNQRLFMDSIGKQLNIKTYSDWENITYKDIINVGGKKFIRNYNSLYDALCNIYPEYKFNIFKFPKIPQNFWDSSDNHRLFLDYVAKEYNIKYPKDWRNITQSMVLKLGGRCLYIKYNSLFDALKALYPNIEWDIAFVNKLPKNYWNQYTIDKFLCKLEKIYNLKHPSDWYRMSRNAIIEHGGVSLLTQVGGISQLLLLYRPNYKWNKYLLQSRDKRASQRQLFHLILKLYPNREVIEDYFHEQLTRISSAPIQFDVFIPQDKIAFEYHGIHHYKDIPSFGLLELYKERDKEKQLLCEKHNIKLYVIPYTWEGTNNHLLEIMKSSNELIEQT